MAIVPLPLSPIAEAPALLHHLLEHGDIVGRDIVGGTMILVAVDDWGLEKLMTFDAEAAELEDGGDAGPDGDPLLQETRWRPSSSREGASHPPPACSAGRLHRSPTTAAT
jgi:hypothetical protein